MLKEKLQEAVKSAMKAGDALTLSTLRMAQSSIHNRAIEERAKKGSAADIELSDEEIVIVLRKEVKRRKDAALEFEKGGRPELAERELKEAVILEAYLPAEADDAAIEAAVRSAISETGSDPKQFGKIMGLAMKKLSGNASGDRVSAVVQKLLG